MWVRPFRGGEFDIPIGARVKAIEGGNVSVVDDDGQVEHNKHVNQCSRVICCHKDGN